MHKKCHITKIYIFFFHVEQHFFTELTPRPIQSYFFLNIEHRLLQCNGRTDELIFPTIDLVRGCFISHLDYVSDVVLKTEPVILQDAGSTGSILPGKTSVTDCHRQIHRCHTRETHTFRKKRKKK